MRERGSALMLMPAAVLVFVVLGAIAVDFAVAFLGEREVSNAAAAAANDAAGAALDRDRFYTDGAIRLDPRVADRVGRTAVAAAGLDDLDEVEVRVEVGAEAPVVTVTVSARVRYVFAKALPGGPDGVRVEASATATAEEDD
jgi:Flp pilus assembly protein TadG